MLVLRDFNRGMSGCRVLSWIAPLAFLCASCGKDPKLVARNQELELEVQDLEAQLAEVHQKLKSQPEDLSRDIEEAEKTLSQMKEEADRLEADLLRLRDEKVSIEQEFSDYRKKYPVK